MVVDKKRYDEHVQNYIELYENVDWPVYATIAVGLALLPIILIGMIFLPKSAAIAAVLAKFKGIRFGRWFAGPSMAAVAALISFMRRRMFLRSPAIWERMWRSGVLSLTLYAQPLVHCNSPDDDWRKFAETLPRG